MRSCPMLLSLSLTILLAGCGKPTAVEPTANTPPAVEPKRPADHAVLQTTARNFLTGLLTGDHNQAKRWLTPAAFAHVAIEPTLLTGVPQAEVQLEVAEVRIVSPHEAVVQCHLRPEGAAEAEELLCLLKRSSADASADWGVSGLAWASADGDAPRVLQFEPEAETPPSDQFVGAGSEVTPERTAQAPEGSAVVR